jgi:hypothetical protein
MISGRPTVAKKQTGTAREHDGHCPTVEFSRRERAADHLQNANDLAREAVGWNALFGAPASVVRAPPAWPTTPASYHAGTTGVRPGPGPAQNHARITGFSPNHAHLESRCPQRAISITGFRTTPCTTGNPHTEPAYHASTTSTCMPRVWHDGRSTSATAASKMGCRSRSPDAERSGFSCRLAAIAKATDIGTGSDSKTQKTPDLARRKAVSWNLLLGRLAPSFNLI